MATGGAGAGNGNGSAHWCKGVLEEVQAAQNNQYSYPSYQSYPYLQGYAPVQNFGASVQPPPPSQPPPSHPPPVIDNFIYFLIHFSLILQQQFHQTITIGNIMNTTQSR